MSNNNNNKKQEEKQKKRKKQEEKNKKMRKKTKRKKTIEKQLQDMSIYYTNIRGMKSKKNSLDIYIEEFQPDIIGIVETHLEEGEELKIEGYEILWNNRNSEGGGVAIGVKQKYMKTVIETTKIKNTEESIWIKMGTKTKYRIGVWYNPKGDGASKQELEEMYQRLESEIEHGKKNNERLLIIGDFNCRVGTIIQGNEDKVTKGGRILNSMNKKAGMILVNAVNEKRKGLWTRIQGEQKSVIDYAIIDKEEVKNVAMMEIDEEKLWTPYYITKENTKRVKKFTDHASIKIQMKWKSEKGTIERRKIMTKSSYQRFKEMISKEQVAKIIAEDEPILTTYSKWEEKIMQIKRKCQIKPRKKYTTWRQRALVKAKKRIKGSEQKTNTVNIARRRLITEHIEREMHQTRADQIRNTIEQIRKNGGGVKEDTFWEFRRKITGKKEEKPHTMVNSEGKIVEDKNEILLMFEKFYTDLFDKKELDKAVVTKVDKEIKHITSVGEKQEPLIFTQKEICSAVKKLKNKKAADGRGWKNEMIKEGGPEMERSLCKIFNKIMKEMKTPKEWEEMEVKSIYKNKGAITEIKNRRGLFLTSVVGKLFEKVMMEKTSDDVKMSKYQNGGRKERSTKDNWLALMTILDNAKRSNEECVLLFADAEKCFDKLWLENCLVDLKAAGLREREVAMVLEMNKEARLRVTTPYGKTNELEMKRVVKQGTVYGPQLCCVNTDQVNKMGESNVTVVAPGVEIKSIVYVDDIVAGGNAESVEAAGRNLDRMERQKGYTFNIGEAKTQYMIINCGRRKEREPEIRLSKGKVTRTEEYKFLGNWINSRGTVERQLEEIERRTDGMMIELRKITRDYELGNCTSEARVLLYQKTVVPSITYNLEMWSKLRNSDWDRLERIQAKAIRTMFNLAPSTPYWGMLSETGIWPLQAVVNYHRLMFYQNALQSEEGRLAKEIIEGQQKITGVTWTSVTKEIGDKYGIDIDQEKVKSTSTREWKKDIKEKINKVIEDEWREKSNKMKKLRHIKGGGFGLKKYISQSKVEETANLMRIRLEMNDIGNNLGNNRNCSCGERETIEHLLDCDLVREKIDEQVTIESLKEDNKVKLEKIRRWIEKYISIRREDDMN